MVKKKLNRLEQLSLNFDDPTAEETTEHQKMAVEPQRMAEDIQYLERNSEHLKQEMVDKYNRFLTEIRNKGISVRLTKDFESKRNILKKYFPVRYENQGLGSYSAEKLGKVFLGFLDYARDIKKK